MAVACGAGGMAGDSLLQGEMSPPIFAAEKYCFICHPIQVGSQKTGDGIFPKSNKHPATAPVPHAATAQVTVLASHASGCMGWEREREF